MGPPEGLIRHWVAPDIDTKPTSFYRGRDRRGWVRLRFGQNEANLLLPLRIQKLKGFQLQGTCPPDQGLCPWTPLWAPSPDPRYRIALPRSPRPVLKPPPPNMIAYSGVWPQSPLTSSRLTTRQALTIYCIFTSAR